jgi:signal recognition particle subunit SRP54
MSSTLYHKDGELFETLTERLNSLFGQLSRRGKLSEADVDLALREVRLALLEADVYYGVVKDLVARVRERAVGAEVSKALNPGQQVIKIVNEELVRTLGELADLNLSGEKPRTILLVGLQGSGKTTTAAKLALTLMRKGERVMLVAADPYRPAAVDQLMVLGEQIKIPVFHEKDLEAPALVGRAVEKARNGGYTVLIVDTAGRSQLDDALMKEVSSVAEVSSPVEILLVVDSMIGQESVRIAEGFRQVIPLTGFVMTKMDGDSRGGAAISIRSVTGLPIKFIGVGEKVEALEAFHPDRMASRILGMGDVLGLIEKAELALDQEQIEKQGARLATGEFTLEDMLEFMNSSKKMGSIGQLLEMLPAELGRNAREVDPALVENSMKRSEAIIRSMTRRERRNPDILNGSRRRRIASGSGTEVQEVNRLMKQFREMQKLMKSMGKKKGFPKAGLFR